MPIARIRFEATPGWEQLPGGMTHLDVVGIDVDSRDNVFVLTRAQPRVLVYGSDGHFLRSWGESFFTERTHGLTTARDDTVYCVDDGAHAVYHFSSDGALLDTIGTVGVASDTGYDGRTIESIRGGGPFNRPTNLALGPSGDLYVTDGYGNARVHRFAADGRLIQSWGEPGTGPGQFYLPHGICIDGNGRVLVADRENDRLQIFDLSGAYQGEWTDIQRPTNVRAGRDGLYYVSELWRPIGHRSFTRGVTGVDLPGRVSILDHDGNVVARWGGPDRCAPGNFVAPHDICVDSRGDIYIGEVTETFGVRPRLVPAGCHTLQKFARQS